MFKGVVQHLCSKELFNIYDLKKKSHVKAKEFFYQFVGFGSQKLPVLQDEQACLLVCLRGPWLGIGDRACLQTPVALGSVLCLCRVNTDCCGVYTSIFGF